MAYGFNNDKSRVNVLPISGGALSGELEIDDNDMIIKATNIDKDGTLPDSTIYSNKFKINDTDDDVLGYMDTYIGASGSIGSRLIAFNKKSDNTSVWNSLELSVDKTGTRRYSVSDPAAFRSAIHAALDTDLNNYLPLTGGTINGGTLFNVNNSFVYKSTTLQRGVSPGASSEFVYPLKVYDKNNLSIAYFDAAVRPSGGCTARMLAWGGANIYNGISANVDPDGTKSYTITDPAAFRDAIGASSGIWPTSIGGTGSANYNNNIVDSDFGPTSIANNTTVQLGTVNVPAGSHILLAGFSFDTNGTGRREVAFDPNGYGSRCTSLSVQAAPSGKTFVNIVIVSKYASSKTYKVTAYQNSGGSLNCNCYVYGFRLR